MNKKNLTSAFVIASLAMFSFSACDSEIENDLQSSNKHSEKLEIEIVQSRIDTSNLNDDFKQDLRNGFIEVV